MMTNQNQEILNQEEQVNTEETQAQQTGQKDSDAATSCAATETTETTTTTEEQPAGQVDLFSMMGIEPPPVKKKLKKKPAKKYNACGATATVGKGKSTKEREMPKNLPIKVVLVSNNVQEDYPAGKSLEEIRQELEMEYPYLTKNNTKWDWEVQKVVDGKVVYDETEKKEDRNDNSTPTPDEEGVTKRILAIPTAKSNKAG